MKTNTTIDQKVGQLYFTIIVLEKNTWDPQYLASVI